LTNIRVFITGIGIISPVGTGLAETKAAIIDAKTGIKPLTLFPVTQGSPMPVGEISLTFKNNLPRTHNLAVIAAREAMANISQPPDAIILGSTTGGMPLTENYIKDKKYDPLLYKYHATGSVADYIAEELKCKGIVLTVSTACSSGTLAIKLALEMLRCGMAKSVLTGGADALCRLTYHGFNSLQLLDPEGARPLDASRKGMSVAEGAAMLLLSAHDTPPKNAVAEILGAGLSCDAYHPASPHPDGVGAAFAMRAALADAGILPEDVDYINLHGTGTIDNDMSEAKAVHAVFGGRLPAMSSVKGAFGHSLGAAGAIEAVISAISITDSIVPANTGCTNPDPVLRINPVMQPSKKKINIVLSNSLGFGGNNASVIISNPEMSAKNTSIVRRTVFSVIGKACITGAGDTRNTFEAIGTNGKCKGVVNIEKVSERLPRNKIRRLKRLPRMILSLAVQAAEKTLDITPSSIFFGTGWGALSDTYDFLNKLYESGEQFPSPTDFIGSVHNAPAGQAAMWFGATGANVTTTGGDYSFEQALLSASLLSEKDDALMIIGADEYHAILSNALDESVNLNGSNSDGGGAILLKKDDDSSGLKISLSFFAAARKNENIINSLVETLGGAERINNSFGAIFAGVPASRRSMAAGQSAELQSHIHFSSPIIDYRSFIGEFASASAVASVIALDFVERGMVTELCGNNKIDLEDKGILILGLGDYITAVEIVKI
jgi:3-oxoacyl-(acyl-carrier-protein) synthase